MMDANKGKLLFTIDRSWGSDYSSDKRVFTLIAIGCIFLIVANTYGLLFLSKSFVTSLVLLLIILLAFSILWYIAIPTAIMRPFQIYEKGIVPADRSLKEWITRKDTFIPFEEIEKVEAVYREKYRDRNPSELRLDPEYVEYVKLTLKDGTTRIISHFWYGIDEECMKELLKVLKKKQLIEGNKCRYLEGGKT